MCVSAGDDCVEASIKDILRECIVDNTYALLLKEVDKYDE